MEQYAYINGVQIPMTAEQAQQIILAHEEKKKQVKLTDIPAGSTFQIAGMEFVVLEQGSETTAVITKKVLKNMAFGSTNNFDDSDVDDYCREFAEDLFAKIGAENVAVHTVDLTSDDGLKDYGTVDRTVSLLTTEQYRKYVDILDQHKPDAWWWLTTPHSTKRHGNDQWVKCVSPAGGIDYDYFNYFNLGVRPFCILKSSIFVSSEK